MLWTEKPVIVVGFGCTGMDLSKLYTLGVPILTSWQAADLIPEDIGFGPYDTAYRARPKQ